MKEKILKIIFINLILFIVFTIIALDIFYKIRTDKLEKKIASLKYYEHCLDYQKDELKPFEILPNSRCIGEYVENRKTVKKVWLGIDENGFRKTPMHYDKNKPSIVFMGCSFTFGYKLKDNETLPWIVSVLTKRHVYNTAYDGNGPQHILLSLESKDFWKKINDPPDTFIYVYIFDQLRRLVSPTNLNEPHFYPMYTLSPNGDLVLNKPSKDFINSSSEQRRRYRLTQFVHLTQHEFKDPKLRALFIAILKESQRIIKQKYPNARFIVFDVYSQDEISECLKKEGFEVINAYELLGNYSYIDEYINVEHHPNNKFWKLVAPKLVKKLNL